MNDELKKQINTLSDLIFHESKQYILELLRNEKITEMDELISLIISSHITSMINILNVIKENGKLFQEPIDYFIENLLKIIPKIIPNVDEKIIINKRDINETK